MVNLDTDSVAAMKRVVWLASTSIDLKNPILCFDKGEGSLKGVEGFAAQWTKIEINGGRTF